MKWMCDQLDDQCQFLIEAAPYTRTRWTPEKFAVLTPLLLAQSYVCDVAEYTGQKVDVNMNDFRAKMFPALRRGLGATTRLTEWQRDVVGAPPSCEEIPWLEVTSNPVARYVINQTERYHNPLFPWERLMDEVGREAVFVGLEAEKEAFDRVSKVSIPHYKTKDLLEAAQVIAGGECFIGNQSVCYAIAEGLKKPALLEIYPRMPNCLFQRPGVVHGWDSSARLPV